jgi:hypothetical protein
LVRGGALVGAAATAAMVASVVPAAAATSDGAHVTDDHGSPHAYALSGQVKLLGQTANLGTISETYLPDGPKSASVASIGDAGVDTHNLISANVLSSKVHKDGKVRAEAKVADLNLLPSSVPNLDLQDLVDGTDYDAADPLLHVGSLESACAIKDGKVVTTSDIAHVKVLGVDVQVPQEGSKTISIGDEDLLKLSINEKTTPNDGEKAVNALHVTALQALGDLASVDLVAAHAHCGPAEEGNGAGNNGGGTTTAPPTTTPPTNNNSGTGQVTNVPAGSVDTGGGATAGVEQPWLFGLGGALILAGGGAAAAAYRKRLAGQR